MRLPLLDLTPEAFAPYGIVIQRPARTQDAAGPGWTWWGEIAYLLGDEHPVGIGFLDLKPAPLEFDWAERHMRTMEMIIPSGECLLYVAPPLYPKEPGRLPSLELFHAFRIQQGQSVLLEKGVWHGAPMALTQPLSAVVLLRKDTSIEDVYVVRFADTPVTIGQD